MMRSSEGKERRQLVKERKQRERVRLLPVRNPQ